MHAFAAAQHVPFHVPIHLPALAAPHIALVVSAPIRGTGAATHLAGPARADPVVIGIALVAIGVIYALALLITVALLRRPRRLKWSARAGRADRQAASGMRRSATGHRPLAARRPAGTHVPLDGATDPVTTPAHDSNASAPAQASATPTTPAWPDSPPDSAAWRPVEYDVPAVGMVRLDARTVRTFAGQPEVLRRLAFQRWRYQAGRCSEFAVAKQAASAGEGPRAARRDGQDGRGAEGGRDDSTSGATPPPARRAEGRPPARSPWRPGRGAPVPHPSNGEAH